MLLQSAFIILLITFAALYRPLPPCEGVKLGLLLALLKMSYIHAETLPSCIYTFTHNITHYSQASKLVLQMPVINEQHSLIFFFKNMLMSRDSLTEPRLLAYKSKC